MRSGLTKVPAIVAFERHVGEGEDYELQGKGQVIKSDFPEILVL